MYHRNRVDCSHEWENAESEPLSRLNRPATGTPPDVLRGLPFFAGKSAVNENVIDVLIYIYENYMDPEESAPTDQILLEEELVQAGFPQGEIKKAFNWLDELAWRQGSMTYADAQPNRSMRIYTEQESRRIDLEIQGMLLYLEQTGILDPMSRELVIERAMAIETEELSADDVKWIVLLVLLNQPGQENAFALMEELVYNGEPVYLH